MSPTSRFIDDRSGVIAPIFALSSFAVIGLLGAAVDYTGATALRSNLQKATDSADLMLCQMSGTLLRNGSGGNNQRFKKQAQDIIDKQLPDINAKVTDASVSTDPTKVTLTTTADYKTAFVSILGTRFSTMKVAADATCVVPNESFEIALVLDTTGSMARSDGTRSKIDTAKQAATNFVNAIFDDPGLQVRSKISLVPFSAAVAVSPQEFRSASWVDTDAKSSLHWRNMTGGPAAGFKNKLDVFAKLKNANANWDWAGCFESQPYPANVQATAPSAIRPDDLFVPMLAPDEAGNGGAPQSTNSRYNANSYLDDNATSCSGTAPTDDQTLMTRACKYVSPANPQRVSSMGLMTGPNFMCNSRPLTRLTTDRTKLLSEIAALEPAGNTNIQQGFMWGWRTIASDSVFRDGSTRNDVQRVVILMTDGVNTWTANSWNNMTQSLYSAFGYFANADGTNPNAYFPSSSATPTSDAQARTAMNALTLEGCKNAAAAGVTVYTIGFSVAGDPIDDEGKALLSACAGSPDRFFMAESADGLTSAFEAISKKLSKLRLTN